MFEGQNISVVIFDIASRRFVQYILRMKGLVPRETVVPCRRGWNTLKFGIRQVDNGQINIINRL